MSDKIYMPLYDLTQQFQVKSGALNVGGYIRVFYASREDVTAPTYKDSDGQARNPEWIILDNNARATVYVDIAFAYNLFVYDSDKNLLWTQYNIYPEGVADITVNGLQYVAHDSTLRGDGTEENPLTIGDIMTEVVTEYPVVGNGTEEDPVTITDIKDLAHDETMVHESTDEAIVLGVNPDYIDSVTSGFQKKSDMDQYATTADLNQAVTSLENQIADETSARIDGDKELSDKIDEEIRDRVSADEALSNEIGKKLDTTAFSTVSGDFATKSEIPSLDGYATESFVTGITDNKLDTTAFSTVSSTFLTAHQDLSEYAKKDEIPTTAGLMQENLLTYEDGKITQYNGVPFAGQGEEGKIYTGISPINVDNDNNTISLNADELDITELEIGEGLKVENNVISVTGQGGGGDMYTSLLEYNSDELITGYNGSAFAGQGSVADSWNLVNGQHIGFTYDDTTSAVTVDTVGLQDQLTNEQLSAISSVSSVRNTVNSYSGNWNNARNWVTANSAATTAVNNLVTATSAAWNGKQDELTFGYNDGKIVSINSSALSAGSNYEGVNPIVVNNETKQISARTKAVHMQTFAHDNTLVHTEVDGVYTLGVNPVGGGLTASINGTQVDSLEIITDNPGQDADPPTNPTINGEELHIYSAVSADYTENAYHADYADNVSNADYASNADHANNADYADEANHATNADNATYDGEGNSIVDTYAKNTDLTGYYPITGGNLNGKLSASGTGAASNQMDAVVYAKITNTTQNNRAGLGTNGSVYAGDYGNATSQTIGVRRKVGDKALAGRFQLYSDGAVSFQQISNNGTADSITCQLQYGETTSGNNWGTMTFGNETKHIAYKEDMETVLWEGAEKDKGSVLQLSETVRHFSKIKIYLRNSSMTRSVHEVVIDLDSAEDKDTIEAGAFLSLTGSPSEIAFGIIKFYPVNETMTISDTRRVIFKSDNTFVHNVTDGVTVTKIIGVNRKAGN